MVLTLWHTFNERDRDRQIERDRDRDRDRKTDRESYEISTGTLMYI